VYLNIVAIPDEFEYALFVVCINCGTQWLWFCKRKAAHDLAVVFWNKMHFAYFCS